MVEGTVLSLYNPRLSQEQCTSARPQRVYIPLVLPTGHPPSPPKTENMGLRGGKDELGDSD